jgi:NADPH2:quinone reductase
VRYDEYGSPEVLRLIDAETPEPGPGQVLIRAERVGLNYIDAVMRRGAGGAWQTDLPGSLTGEVVGHVERIGPGVAGVAVGDRVAALVAKDACADLVLAEADWLASVPADLDGATATALPMLAPLASGLLRLARLEAGETVLVHAAAGAVGHLAVQLAKQRGARVIGTTGTATKADAIRRYGADVVADSSTPEWTEQVRAAAAGGVDVVLDSLGGDATTQSLGLMAPYGRAVVYGALQGEQSTVTAMDLYGLKSISGFSFLGWRAARPEDVRAEVAALTEQLRTGTLRLAVAAEIPLDEVVKAHELLEDRTRVGRVVLSA